MTRTPPAARTPNRRIPNRRLRWLLAVGLAVVMAVIAAALVHQVPKLSSSSARSSLSPPLSLDDSSPAVTNLDPGLLKALRQAATAAADDGVEFHVNSGWRSPEHQNQLLREAVSKYGSEEEAARWVATAETSPHVSGDAVDIGRSDATAWLSEHGAEYGLCQIYKNEPWHYELRTDAIDRGCPRMYADPTQDPRMQQ
ncbi:M15 family metallopeptidase [Streptomyces sp. NBC_01381]|uniref:M15 family metallopeptidase n=1 Tax=Streptomyces sp. NBC_01381 TaxID=2903845 RepID=UPI00225077B2|nr:M15 family metallopeptidase [Streptomyces sp. NBC_01381]MCX4672939.1 M15 family metallopeptidase [Streptomyces sp. NBC_01381]